MKRQLSYQFDLDIERVHLLINMKCDVQVWWKSGKGKIATKNSIKLTGTQKYFDVKQKLSIIAKIVMQNGILREKKTQLLIILFTSQNTSKLGGRVNLNLAEFISPENLTVPIVKKFQRSLQNCPDQLSKIVFNLSCKYIEESFGGSSENPHDISFQANNFTNSFSTSSNFGRSTVDMTFRPQKQQFSVRKQLSNPGNSAGNIQSTRSQYPSRQKKRIQNERDWQKQKLETPSWQRSQKQRQTDYNVSNVGNNRNRDFEKPPQPPQILSQNQPRVLQFSFNPTQADRLKLGIDNSQIVKDLKQIVEQKTRTIKSLQEQLFKLRSEYEQKNQKSSSKSLTLLNQLNTTSSIKDQLQRQRSQLMKQVQFLREQNKKLQQKTKSIHLQYAQKNNENNSKIQHMKKIIDQLNNKLEDADRKIIKYKDQLFKKESQLISKQKQFASTQLNKQSINREQTEKLKNISLSLKELQSNFENVFMEKEELKRKYEQSMQRITKYEQSRMQINQATQKYEQQLQKQRQKAKLIETKYKQRESLIHEIENEFKKFSNDKINELRQKDQELAGFRDKFNVACKKIDQKSAAEQSMKNMISQKNIRIKTLQGICNQLQKSLEEKQTLITKAKEYVSTKQQQIELKNTQIGKRDEFIQKCRTYMQTKQKQYNDVIAGTKSNSSQTMSIKKQLKQKQNMLQQYIYQRHQTEKQIQDMQRLIDRLKQRIMQCEDTMDQLQRKNQSQQQTLKTLVKKNLDMEIQLNMREYQIQSLRAIK